MGARGITPMAHFSLQRSLLYPTSTSQLPCDRGWQGLFSLSCPAITSYPAGLKQLFSFPEQLSSLLSALNLTGPRLLSCKYDTPLTHVLLYTSSHGSTQLVLCQVQSHHGAEGPRFVFYAPHVARGHRLGSLGLAPSNCPPISTLVVRP